MLTGALVRVRYARDRIVPYYIDPEAPEWQEVAGSILDLFRQAAGRRRGELEDELEEMFGDDNNTLVHQGLAKLLEGRCDFEAEAGHPPEQLRREVFQAAAAFRTAPLVEGEA